jgi:hypothetical protein
MNTRSSRKYKKNNRKHNKNGTRNSKKYSRKYRNTMKNVARGGPYKCCMCNKKFKSKVPLSPSDCIIKNGKKTHKICKDCWWDKFALEGVNHKCPGCPPEVKKPKKKSGSPEVIVISSS